MQGAIVAMNTSSRFKSSSLALVLLMGASVATADVMIVEPAGDGAFEPDISAEANVVAEPAPEAVEPPTQEPLSFAPKESVNPSSLLAIGIGGVLIGIAALSDDDKSVAEEAEATPETPVTPPVATTPATATATTAVASTASTASTVSTVATLSTNSTSGTNSTN